MVSGLNPSHGPIAGGNPVVITGSGFSGATRVRFGGVDADFTFESDTRLIATAPPAPEPAPAPVNVTVSGPRGTSTQIALYGYLGLPAVTWVVPDAGPLAGNNAVTVNGANLTTVGSVLFGETPAPSFHIVSDTRLTATAPPGSGSVQVSVSTPGGASPAVPCGLYTYLGFPAVTGLNPDRGPSSGGTGVVIEGSSFTHAETVAFGAVQVPFTVVSDTQIVADVPGGSGTVPVTVANALEGTSPGAPYTYL